MNKITKIEQYVKENNQNERGHTFSHVHRVRNWALKIAKEENHNNLEMVEAAALLHDIGLPFVKNRREHGNKGAELAEKFLKENDLFNTLEIKEISNAIKYHCKNREGEGELLNIIRDADMMDLFGAHSIIRVGESEAAWPDYDFNNIKGETWQMTDKDFDQRFDQGIGVGKYKVDMINFHISCYYNLTTNTAKKIAKPLIEYQKKFILQLEKEVSHDL